MMESMPFVGTTAADGSLVITQKIYHARRLVKVRWLAGNFDNGVDATLDSVGISEVESALGLAAGDLDVTVLTLSDANDDAWHDADAIVDHTLRLTVSAGGNAKTGGCVAYFDEAGSSSMALVASDLNLGNVDIASVAIPSAFPAYGQKAVTTAGTRVALVASSTPLTEGWVEVIAWSTNTGVIYVGDVGVTSSNGVRLGAGMSVPVRVDNLNEIYIDASVSNEGCSFIGW